MKWLRFENVSVRYHYDEFYALADLSFEVNEGETVSVMLGAQGCLLYTSPSPRDRG